MSKTVKKQMNKNVDVYQKWIVFPIFFAIAIIPLIVRAHSFDPKLSQFLWYSSETEKTDIFLYFKLIALIVTSLFMIGVLLYHILVRKFNVQRGKTIYFLPLCLYAVIAVLSSVFSKYSYFSYHGIAESFETIWVLLSYCILAYYTYMYIDSELAVNKLMKAFYYGAGTVTIIGVLQFIHLDIFRTNIVKRLITPSVVWDRLDEFSFNFPLGKVYTTLYNPNYVGVYASMIIPIALVLLMLQFKNKKSILLYASIIIGQVICFIGSGSKTALISLCLSIIFIIVLLRKQILFYKKVFLPVCALLLVGVIGLFTVKANSYSTIITNLLHPQAATFTLQDVQTNDDNVTIKYKDQILVVQMESDGQNCNLTFTDESGNQVSYAQNADTGMYDFSDVRYTDLSFEAATDNNIAYFGILINGNKWYFTNMTDDGTYYYRNLYGKLTKIQPTKGVIFNSYPTFASGRGYIWSRSLYLLKDHIILGTGADTFQIAFPQYDYVGLRNAGYVDALIGKAHNMYIQIALQTGVLSLVGFLGFYLMYMISSIRLYWKNQMDTYLSQIGVAVLVGTFGYMVSGLSNDSTLSVAPVFWVLIGLGLAVNYQVRNGIKQAE